jgi:prepilin-type N-terminal cleavage/methylation domain-containing protein
MNAATKISLKNKCRLQEGFTLLELAVVVVIVGTLFLFSYQKYLDLLVDVEKANLEQTVGILRSAVGMQVAKMVVDGKVGELKKLEGVNPVQFLAEVPDNYLGEVADPKTLQGQTRIWFFDPSSGFLIYRVKNRQEFFSEIAGFDQARFKLSAVYADKKGSVFAGLSLKPVEKYSWFVKR